MGEDFLRQTVALARTRRGFCAPNPAVGAVVVKDGKVLGLGYHWAAGHPHAEVEALKGVGPEAEGATVYVSLEPCCHFGRTPPCTDLLIEKRVGRVVFGFLDPNPKVAGKGREKLRAAGIPCHHQPNEEIDAFYESYAHWTRSRQPFVTVKLAVSLDGKIAASGARPVAISGQAAAEATHQKRKRSDAILTTAATVLADDPRLDARPPDGPFPKPVYIADSLLRTPPSARLFKTSSRVTIFHSRGDESKALALEAAGASVVKVAEARQGGLSLDEMLGHIGESGAHDLWVEAGGRFTRRIIESGAARRAIFYVSPKLLGGDAYTVCDGGFLDLSREFKKVHWQGCGEDALCELSR